MSLEPITAMYATLDDGFTAIPRGSVPSGMRRASLKVARSMTLISNEHQLVTRTYRLSGVTATNFGTIPTCATPVMASVARSTRYTKLGESPRGPVQLSLPSGPKLAPYIE